MATIRFKWTANNSSLQENSRRVFFLFLRLHAKYTEGGGAGCETCLAAGNKTGRRSALHCTALYHRTWWSAKNYFSTFLVLSGGSCSSLRCGHSAPSLCVYMWPKLKLKHLHYINSIVGKLYSAAGNKNWGTDEDLSCIISVSPLCCSSASSGITLCLLFQDQPGGWWH